MERRNAWKDYTLEEEKELEALCGEYRKFLDGGKTERECVEESVALAEAKGYRSIEEYRKAGTALKPGDKVYMVRMNKIIALYHIGEEPLEKGMNILGAHIDSPRLDVKQNPLYENGDLAYLDTHYYGGVKKYQWVAIPLAIHGVVAKKDGSVMKVVIGEDESDPIVYVSDLLIHLSHHQLKKPGDEMIEGENLDVLIGSRPLKNETDQEVKEIVKANIVRLLEEKYGMEEEDFISAELEIVPAGKARDCGLDRSMIASYGQDDRVCGYTSLAALLSLEETPKKTACCLLVDKEEIGSCGATGMQSDFFEDSVSELFDAMGAYSGIAVRRCFQNSCMLSSDVSAAFDPLYPEAFEKKNTAYFGRGVAVNKFTGSRGKSGANDANAEYLAKLRRILDDNHVAFQTCEIGRVDFGGGGTISHMAARRGIHVVDSGVAVLSMHAPTEVTSKSDVYEAKKCYEAFLKNA